MIEKTNQVLELLEARHLADREMNGISPGEAHRLLIGRALVHDPMALLLDEPSNSLDFRAALELRDILRKLARAGTGILMVTHHLPDILPEIDRVILLREGRVFADGPKNALLTTERLSRIIWPSRGGCAARRLLSPVVIRSAMRPHESAQGRLTGFRDSSTPNGVPACEGVELGLRRTPFCAAIATQGICEPLAKGGANPQRQKDRDGLRRFLVLSAL